MISFFEKTFRERWREKAYWIYLWIFLGISDDPNGWNRIPLSYNRILLVWNSSRTNRLEERNKWWMTITQVEEYQRLPTIPYLFIRSMKLWGLNCIERMSLHFYREQSPSDQEQEEITVLQELCIQMERPDWLNPLIG